MLQFTILGLGTGGIFALMALGLVLIYRGSGVVNFAQGAMGMVGTFTFYELIEVQRWGFVAAFVLAMVVCATTGLLVQILVMYPLRNRSPLIRILATLGVLAVLQGFTAIRYSVETVFLHSSLPTSTVTFLGATVGVDRLGIFGIACALSLVLGVIYKYTQFGIQTTAGSENPRALALLGHSAPRIAAANWAIGSMLAGLAGILLVPISGLEVASLTLLVVPALAAAVVGKMMSFPITFAAALVIGVAESLVQRYVTEPGWPTAVPFIIVFVALMARGSTLPGKSDVNLRLPAVGSGRIKLHLVIPALAVLVWVAYQVRVDWVDGLTITMIGAVLLLSIVVVTGYAGQLSLAQIALAAMGALVAARLTQDHGFSFLPAALLGMIVAIPVGVLVGIPALRARGANLAILTLAMSVAIEAVVFNSPSLGSGDLGLATGFPELFGLDVNAILYPERYFLVVLGAFVITAVLVANLRRGKSGRRLLATRENERAAAAVGVNVLGAKLYAFSVSSVIAALAGVLMAYRQPTLVMSSTFKSFQSVLLVGNTVIGGVGFIMGAIVGGILQVGGISTNLGNLITRDAVITSYITAFAGMFFVLILIRAPDGVAALYGRALSRVGQVIGRSAARTRRPTPQEGEAAIPGAEAALPALASAAAEMPGSGDAPETVPVRAARFDSAIGTVVPRTLETRDLSVSFGGNAALVDFNLDLQPGEVVGLIGPNGAGKSTCIDAITGFVKPARGVVLLDGQDIGRWSPRRRAVAGLARSFQSLELFEDITVFENLMVATEARSVWSYVTDLVHPGKPKLSRSANEVIAVLRLEPYLDRFPRALPHGVRTLVGIARTLAMEPSVLMLDEPASGLSGAEREELGILIRELAEERRMAILLIEHDVDFVMTTCDRVVALDFGHEIASGTPQEVRANAAVQTAYLGEPESTVPTDAAASAVVEGRS